MAAGDGHFELAGQVVELGVAREMTIEFKGNRRRIVDFVGIETGQRAARDVRATSPQAPVVVRPTR